MKEFVLIEQNSLSELKKIGIELFGNQNGHGCLRFVTFRILFAESCFLSRRESRSTAILRSSISHSLTPRSSVGKQIFLTSLFIHRLNPNKNMIKL